MRAVMTILGVAAAIAVFTMLLRCPDVKENFQKEHRKSLVVAFIPMIAFLVLVALLMSHVGL